MNRFVLGFAVLACFVVSQAKLVSEYDWILVPAEDDCRSGRTESLNGPTPLDFEAAMKATGITEEEYAACNTPIHQEPHRQMCSSMNATCYKDAVDINGNPARVPLQCPRYGGSWEDPDCRRGQRENGQQLPNCHLVLACNETVPQWSSGAVPFKTAFPVSTLNPNSNKGECHDPKGRLSNWDWDGGVDPLNPVNTFDNISNFPLTLNFTKPYPDESIFCLKKAALKALSRDGWELTDPSQAFTSERWTVIKKTPVETSAERGDCGEGDCGDE